MQKDEVRKLGDDALISETVVAVKVEAQSTEKVLEFLAEIDRRYLYAKRGHDSLFSFCRNVLHYSEGAASRRVGAVRTIRAIPEAKESLSSGAISLSTINQLKSFIYHEEKAKGKLGPDQKLELLRAIENKSQAECTKTFIEISPASQTAITEKVRPLTPELTEIKLTISKELEEKLLELSHLLSHKNKSGTKAGLLEIISDLALKQLKPEAKKNDAVVTQNAAAPAKNADTLTRPSVAENRREAYRRANYSCQYEDPLTKIRCQSRKYLHVDHIIPKALWPTGREGLNNIENLRILCRTHNNLVAIEAFSAKHMSRFLPGFGG